MSRSLLGLRKEAEKQYDKWRTLAFDHAELAKLNKTQIEAVQLVNYFEGMVDAYNNAHKAATKCP